jgi:hypothetical protein
MAAITNIAHDTCRASLPAAFVAFPSSVLVSSEMPEKYKHLILF